jgi:general secretion pathway protein D
VHCVSLTIAQRISCTFGPLHASCFLDEGVPLRLTRAWLLLLAGAGAASLLHAETASRLYHKGLLAERSGAIAQAYLYYSEAAAADPKKALYRERAGALAPMAAVQAAAVQPAGVQGKFKPPSLGAAGDDDLKAANHAVPVDLRPEAIFDSITARELAAGRQLLPPARLDPLPGTQDYALEGDYKSVFQQMATRLGIQVIFDSDYQTGKHLLVRLGAVGPRDALHALEAVTNSFIVPVGPKLILVAQDTEAKRKDLEQVETANVPVPTALTIQEITELGQVVKQAIGVDKVFWDSQANSIVLKDRISRVRAAQSVLNDLISYRSQVAVDLEFVELDDTEMMDVGVDLEPAFPISFLGLLNPGVAASTVSTATSTPAAAATASVTLAQLAKLSLSHVFGIGIPNIDVTAMMTKAGARTLFKTTVVSVEGQKATFHSGEKYPIMTSQWMGPSTSSNLSVPTPSFTFEDLGIVVTITPRVESGNEVNIELDTEYKLLGAANVNGIPILNNRKLQSTVRLKDNQWALVAGLTSLSKSRTLAGPSFFSRVPLLGHIISHFTRNDAKTYVFMLLRPHVLSLPASERVTHEVYLGSDRRSVTPL